MSRKLTPLDTLNCLENDLVSFWNAYIAFLQEMEKENSYITARTDLFNREVALSVHDIQGRLAILKEHLK